MSKLSPEELANLRRVPAEYMTDAALAKLFAHVDAIEAYNVSLNEGLFNMQRRNTDYYRCLSAVYRNSLEAGFAPSTREIIEYHYPDANVRFDDDDTPDTPEDALPDTYTYRQFMDTFFPTAEEIKKPAPDWFRDLLRKNSIPAPVDSIPNAAPRNPLPNVYSTGYRMPCVLIPVVEPTPQQPASAPTPADTQISSKNQPSPPVAPRNGIPDATLTFDAYQAHALETNKHLLFQDETPRTLALGLLAEAGEVAGKLYKAERDGYAVDEVALMKELGDVCWFCAVLASAFHRDFSEVAQANLDKLADRARRGVIGGSGDER